ncbi:LLM class flavin-dependent oxidoreductase [Erysipelothrix urinaevulpis]|uniref:LLM class flavin-dependent oxidoreductase n=1 Tax=Erysipelothrix urinaevulpis TaxID=2683717 RepID=UPI00135A43C8|nr:LLM class flavin-dependent oxidoreductase [Erysipelothrix urinaevulpis]
MKKFEIGIYSLGDYLHDPATGKRISEQERIEQIINAAKLADELGLDIFALGESHQEHFISQAHAVILGAIARETNNITLSSSATIVSTSDPVRIYENFTTIDLMSNGRAEIVGGRASRLGLFELLGYNVRDYETLFEEKFELLLKLNKEDKITWRGRFRAPLEDAVLYPKPLRGSLPIWRAVGGPPQSAVLAGQQGVPMMLATLAGPASLFNHSVEAYRKNYQAFGHNLDEMRVGVTNLFHTAETDEKAFKNFYQYVNNTFINSNGHPFNREAYVDALDIRNVILVGSPQTIIDKILYQYEIYNNDRVMLQLDLGGMPWDQVDYNIRMIAEVIAPAVRQGIAQIDERKEEE